MSVCVEPLQRTEFSICGSLGMQFLFYRSLLKLCTFLTDLQIYGRLGDYVTYFSYITVSQIITSANVTCCS